MSFLSTIEQFFTGAENDAAKVANIIGLTSAGVQQYWGIALGLAQVAEVVEPALAPAIAAALAIANPIVGDIEAGLATAAQLEALAAQAAKLVVSSAPSIIAVPNTPSAPAAAA